MENSENIKLYFGLESERKNAMIHFEEDMAWVIHGLSQMAPYYKKEQLQKTWEGNDFSSIPTAYIEQGEIEAKKSIDDFTKSLIPQLRTNYEQKIDSLISAYKKDLLKSSALMNSEYNTSLLNLNNSQEKTGLVAKF